jgi:hypothetical protein
MRARRSQQGGADTLVVTLLVVPLFVFLFAAAVPFFVYMVHSHDVQHIAHHALTEAETIGYVSPALIQTTKDRFAQMGYPAVTERGVSYPSFEGSTTQKVLRSQADNTVRLVIAYPSPPLIRYVQLLRKTPSRQAGVLRIDLVGKSEAYE